MIIYGSIRHTTCGRKMKRPWQTRRRKNWRQQEHEKKVFGNPLRSEEKQYPSAPLGKPVEDETAKKEYYSSGHTIAPAYNKGAYQVISKENVKDIGR